MIAFFSILAIFIIAVVIMYNFLIKRKNEVDSIFSSIEALLKKRYDLLANLFDIISEIMVHERSLFREVNGLRKLALKTNDADTKLKLDVQIQNPLHDILVSMENYPILKSNENVLKLQTSLNEIEEQISVERKDYNKSVNSYNNAIQIVPTNIIAKILKYEKRFLYEIPFELKNISSDDLLTKNE